MPSRGKGITASSLPFTDYRKKPGDRVSDFNWRIPAIKGRNAVRYLLFDTNYWKSFLRSRIRVAKGDPSALTIFGRRASAGFLSANATINSKTQNANSCKLPADAVGSDYHRNFAEHITAEYSIRTEGRGRVIDEWQMRPGRADNHWFDCLVGCAVGASEQGVMLPSVEGSGKRRRRPKVKLSELQRRRR